MLLLAAISLGILAIIESKSSTNRKKRTVCFLGITLLYLLFILSDKSIYFDIGNYHDHFLSVQKKTFLDILQNPGFEIGYSLLNKSIGFITFGNFEMFLAITYAIVFLLYLYLVKKQSKKPTLSIFLFLTIGFWGMSVTVIRQGIAMVFALLSIDAFLDKKNMKCFLFFLVSFSFHYSSLVMILVFIFSKLKINIYTIVLSLLISIYLFLFGDSAILLINKLLNKTYLIEKSINIKYLIPFLILCIGELYLYIKKFKTNKKVELLCVSGILTCIFYVISFFNYSFVRISYYFFIIQFLYLPELLDALPKKHRTIQMIGIISVCIFFYSFIVKFNSGAMHTYQFFW